MILAYQVAITRHYQVEKTVPTCWRVVKRLVCVVCGATREIDPMYTGALDELFYHLWERKQRRPT